MTPFLHKHIRLALLLGAAPLLNGCLMTYGWQEQQTAQQEDMAIVQEKIRRLEGRLEGYDLALQQLQQTVDSLQARPQGPSNAELDAVQTRLTALDGQLRSLDAARQRDRQEIIDTLSAKVASLVGSSGSRGSSKPSTPRKASASQEGYEHVVQGGETISAIAAAYKVRAQDIMDANNITDPSRLRAGQKLFIPAP